MLCQCGRVNAYPPGWMFDHSICSPQPRAIVTAAEAESRQNQVMAVMVETGRFGLGCRPFAVLSIATPRLISRCSWRLPGLLLKELHREIRDKINVV